MQTFRTYAEAVAFLVGEGWSRSSTDVMVYFRGNAKARLKSNSSGYSIAYSKQRKK